MMPAWSSSLTYHGAGRPSLAKTKASGAAFADTYEFTPIACARSAPDSVKQSEMAMIKSRIVFVATHADSALGQTDVFAVGKL
jgi:hypothetical protein